jgi:hypothetical protein
MVSAMRWALAPVIALSACYSPTFSGGAPCVVGSDSCPTGQTCVAMGSGGVCMKDGSNGIDGGTDTSHPDGATCLGVHLLGDVCLMAAPMAAVTVTAARTVTTTSTTAGNCTEMQPQRSGPPLCIISGSSIDLAAGITLRGIGSNPLVLFASGNITIEGTIDVATHTGETINGTQVLGAGSRTAADCAAIGIDGTQGNMVGNNDDGGGGAAGGSFGGAGGAGGQGGEGNIAHGNPVIAGPPVGLVGGCPGGHGGNGSTNMNSGGGGAGGAGGGAVYLVAGGSITIAAAGKINASGQGGGPGVDGQFSSGGGGGGGAGGLIGLEAPTVASTGALFANGGGGGGGGGSQPTNRGLPGNDVSVATAAAKGGTGGSGGGGPGGDGAFVTTAAKPGTAASTNSGSECAGGGGGGGAGFVKVFSTSSAALGGTVSPPATH